MRALLLVFAVYCFHGRSSALTSQTSQAVAIIGAGIGGTSTAFFLRQRLGNTSGIEIFERERVGGRAQVFFADGRAVELGASIIHEQNRHLRPSQGPCRELSDLLGLKRVEPGAGSRESLLAIYNGRHFVFTQSSWTIVTVFRMVVRYGLSLFQFRQAPKDLLSKFLRIYSSQKEGQPFSSPEDLLRKIGLFDLTQRDMRSEIQGLLGSGAAATKFAQEFIAGINHINYNQGNGLNAFAGMVSMLPTIDDRLFAVEGGNVQLAIKLLQAAQARLHQPAEISVIQRAEDGSYLLHSKAGGRHGPYAAVVIAAPLALAKLSFEGLKLPKLPPQKYQTTVTTIHQGRLRPSYFHVKKLPAGEYIMVAQGANVPFSVIAPITAYVNGTRLYKTFSSARLSQEVTKQLFAEHSILAEHPWEAYPRFHPPEQFAPFTLSQGLYYNNALENAASAMEIAAIEGKNSALLVEEFLTSIVQQTRGKRCKNAELR